MCGRQFCCWSGLLYENGGNTVLDRGEATGVAEAVASAHPVDLDASSGDIGTYHCMEADVPNCFSGILLLVYILPIFVLPFCMPLIVAEFVL